MDSELTEKTDIKELWSSDRPGDWEAAALGAHSFRGWILYDGDCRSCAGSAKRFERIFRRRGFLFLPLQTDWVMKRLDLEPGAPLEEMRVLTSDGRDIGGADAVIFLGRQTWWAWPFVALARLPGMHKLLDRSYRWIAAHRGCDHIACEIKKRRLPSRRFTKTAVERLPLLELWPGWIALIVCPPLALLARNHIAPWQFMWLMAGAIFLGCKWLTFWIARRQIVHVRVGRALAYFFLWPGMDAEKFLRRPAGEVHKTREQALVSRAAGKPSGNVPDRAGSLWPGAADGSERMLALPFPSALGKMLLGVVLLFGVARFAHQPLLTGWIGMIGIILILHFGLFHLLAVGWRIAGLDAEPIMDAPLRSKSLSEFWGRRWNAAFNRLTLDFVFRPLARRHGTTIATMAAFLVSGLIHELLTSLPAGAGYGLPTVYFLLQGIGILTERALPQIRGQIFTIVITAVPAFWLFHPPFVRNVILPFMKAIGAV
jgi:alginate O-acetyltransferase complex protein AlgI